MKRNERLGLTAWLIALLGIVTTTPVHAGGWSVGNDPEVVMEWNEILQTNIPPTAGLFSFRYYSMMHIAMFDAVNSIERDYERYHVKVWANPAASTEAAAAQAAHDVLVALIPEAQGTFGAALQNRLAKIPSWRAGPGVVIGKKVAQAVIDWRTGDGSEQPNIPYIPPALPGLWQPTPPTQIAGAVHFAHVEPFGLLTATQYLPDPPPLLNSPEYATAVEQVRSLGSATLSTRTDEQTQIALLFAASGYSPNPFALWSNVARNLARSQNLSIVRAARLFALLNVAMNDGLQTAHTSKYVYGLWRPVTAIQRADEDLNDATVADPSWQPLLATPPYPSHSSNLTCIAASAARTLARVLHRDAVPFDVTWTGTGGNANVTRSYASFAQLAEEAGISRVYGGIHFQFELTASHESCANVSDFIVSRHARPTP
jgi:hypothetical protein